MPRRKKSDNSINRDVRSALTPEADEQIMISLAMDLVKKRLLEGTASSQETTHFLKLATEKARLENELLAAQTAMALAKKSAIEENQRTEALIRDAIKAFKEYSGESDSEDGDIY